MPVSCPSSDKCHRAVSHRADPIARIATALRATRAAAQAIVEEPAPIHRAERLLGLSDLVDPAADQVEIVSRKTPRRHGSTDCSFTCFKDQSWYMKFSNSAVSSANLTRK